MIQQLEHITKEIGEVVLRSARRLRVGAPPEQWARALGELRRVGFSVVHDFWPEDQCRRAVAQIDKALEDDEQCYRWTDDLASDRRLYYAERIGGELENFFRTPLIEELRRHHSGVFRADTLLLAAKLRFVEGNKGSGGGWHRDSPHRSQFKAMLYLTDVELANGPFEYLERMHRASDSLRLLKDGTTAPNQYRFSDAEVDRLMQAGAVRHSFVARAGTLILVDTKGIHRGRPIVEGERYALTQYCFDGRQPSGFLPQK